MSEMNPATSSVVTNLQRALHRVTDLAAIAGKTTPRLVAVSKTKPAELISACYDIGHRHFGENYIQELEDKANLLQTTCPDLRWHFIGRIQSNKIKKLCQVPNLWCVETIDNKDHCDIFQKSISQLNMPQLNIFIQVNTSGEQNKAGLEINEVPLLAEHVVESCPDLKLIGLMTIGSISESFKMPKVLATQRKLLLREDGDEAKREGMDWEIPEKDDDQFRKILVKGRVLNGPVGSAYLEIGNTKVMCSVNGPKEQGGDFSPDGSLNVFLHGIEHETNIKFTIVSALNAVVCLKKFSRAKIDIELNVIADDGGILAACIMAAGVALISANIECFDLVLACNLLVCEGGDRFILDPTLGQIKKHKGGGVTATIAIIPSLGQIVCTDVDGPIRKSNLDKLVRFGFQKCLELYPLMSETLRTESGNLF